MNTECPCCDQYQCKLMYIQDAFAFTITRKSPLTTKMILFSIGIKALINKYIHKNTMRCNYSSMAKLQRLLVKIPLKLARGWVIVSHIQTDVITYPCPNPNQILFVKMARPYEAWCRLNDSINIVQLPIRRQLKICVISWLYIVIYHTYIIYRLRREKKNAHRI